MFRAQNPNYGFHTRRGDDFRRPGTVKEREGVRKISKTEWREGTGIRGREGRERGKISAVILRYSWLKCVKKNTFLLVDAESRVAMDAFRGARPRSF